MGLDKKDAEGFRLRPDGKRLTIILEDWGSNPVHELLVAYWKDIGVDVRIKVETFGLYRERTKANKVDMRLGGGNFNLEPAFSTLPQFYVPIQWGWASSWACKWNQWYATGGKEGEKPPKKIMDLINWYEKLKLATTKEERVKWAQKILESHAENLWLINLVSMTPAPIIVKKNLRNIPAKALWSWDIMRIVPYHPEQFFFKAAKPQ